MTLRNMTFIDSLDEFCIVDVPTNETAPFDFGIFLDSLKNGNTGSIYFPKKFFYSFWWGLRNLRFVYILAIMRNYYYLFIIIIIILV